MNPANPSLVSAPDTTAAPVGISSLSLQPYPMQIVIRRITAHRQLLYTALQESRWLANTRDCSHPHVYSTRRQPQTASYLGPLHARCFSEETRPIFNYMFPHEPEDTEDIMAGASSASSGLKRKRTASAFYAVKVGFTPGIYQSWDDAKQQTSGFKNPVFKRFTMLTEAEDFMKSESVSASIAGKTKYYGVQVGHTPGVYVDWPAVLEQVTGVKGAKQKRFDTWEEAQAFVSEAQQGGAFSHTTSTPMSPNSHVDLTTPSEFEPRKSTKKHKPNGGPALPTATNGDYEPGTGPLPPDSEDGFDRRIKHGWPNGPEIEYKTQEELNLRKLQPTGDFEGALEVYTDGASKGNGQLGAYAGFGIWFGPNDPRNNHGPLPGERQTNQRAELTAIARAIDIVPIDREARIYTDSHYSMKCLTDWFQNWEEKGWKNSAGRPVENRDLIEPILTRIRERDMANARTHIVWVKAHNGNPGNEAADRLANDGAEEKRQEIEAKKLTKTVADEEQAGEDVEEQWIIF
ncbi:hypothetical protein PMIN06_005374 [Paraphaeosphaeria minitans]